jgi:hypothetical protein
MKKVFQLGLAASFMLLTAAFNVIYAQCITPSGLSAASGGAGVAVLSWGATGADTYSVNLQDGPGNPEVLDVTTPGITTTSYTATGLTPGFSYKFKVRGYCGGDHSDWSAVYTFTASDSTGGGGDTIVFTPCDEPTGLSVSEIGTSSALLSWSSVDAASKYRVRVEDGSGNPVPFALTAGTVTNSYTVSGLNAGSNYKFKVRTICTMEKSGWSDWFDFATNPLRLGAASPAQIYPNPAGEYVNIQVQMGEEMMTLNIVDVSGRVWYTETLSGAGAQLAQIGTSDFPAGIYQVILRSETDFSTTSFMVTH